MKKLTKLNLNDLKVESFVTSLENESSNTVKGGGAGVVAAVALGSAGAVIMSAIASAIYSYALGQQKAPANDAEPANNK